MKPYKFRVWDNINKEFCNPEDFYISCYGEIHKRLMCADKIIHQNNARYEVSDSAGFFDKNGKEIFFGDILKQTLLGNEEIILFDKYDHDDGYTFNCGCCSDVFGWEIIKKIYPEDCEIIGNKYENPELIEKIA